MAEQERRNRGKKRTEDGRERKASTSEESNSYGMDQENGSEDNNSVISEHLVSSNESVENDRSLQEIEIFNVPGVDDVSRISQEDRPESLGVSVNSDGDGKPEAAREVLSILEEILRNEQFKSESERAVQRSYSSTDQSLDIFENLNVTDASLDGYITRHSNNSLDDNCHSTNNEKNLNAGTFLVEHCNNKTIEQLEELLAAKDTAMAAVVAELESVKDTVGSNSSVSCPTSTEYRLYQEEYQSKMVEFQNALAHRDDLIQQLTESLQQSLHHREDLQRQSEKFATEIIDLQEKLAETTAIVKNHKCHTDDDTKQLNSLSDVPSDLREFLERYIKKKLEEVEGVYRKTIEEYENKLESEQAEHERETNKLRELLAQINSNASDVLVLREDLVGKHAKEMEELRTYFEKKCADLEKHYSEEVFSQQSRRMSGSSSCSELASDLLFSGGSHAHPGGPGGDSGPPSFDVSKFEIVRKCANGPTRKDLVRLREDLEAVAKEFAKYDLEKIGKQELNALKSELAKYDLQGLSKYDFTNIKAELQNKYHAELEVLREDYENRIDLLNVEHENRLRDIQRKYGEEIETLKYDLGEAMKLAQSGSVQEVASSGEFEITEVVQSYERRLQEQVALAKLDILANLESQIQRLAADESDDEEWPMELLKLRDRFTERYEVKIAEMVEKHDEEVGRLKEEHLKMLNGALERARRRSLRDDSLTDVEIIKDRDTLKKTNKTLRHLITELLRYFTKCEDELNNTLLDELLKHDFDKSYTQLEENTSIDLKRVHFAPDFTEVLNILDASSLEQRDLSLDFKNELDVCLEKLKSDANAILAATVNLQTGKQSIQSGDDEKLSSLKRQLINETHSKNDLNTRLLELQNYVVGLESEKERVEQQNELLLEKQKVLQVDLGRAHEKIAELIENGHKEVISEGYGEKIPAHRCAPSETFAELQEKARGIISEWEVEPDNPVLVLLEDLCKEGDRITEEARRDHQDLLQQIEAADKKYRATSQFLEEQASEREQERDEAQKQIAQLREQLREREKDRASCERVNSEVEQLEQQMREMSRLIEENDTKQQQLETERQEAIEKIHVLRDIIRDLEAQVETKAETEAALRTCIVQLENVVKQQGKTNVELSRQLEAVKGVPDEKEFREHIAHLEEEVQRLRLSEELVGSEGELKQIKLQLFEFETSLEKRTLDLEGLHATVSNTSCSTPTEDMSIKDQIRPHTPLTAPDECDVPLQQLARLKEKLIKHSRAEDAAMKRIRDLEMQLSAMKRDYEEVQHERDALQDQVTEQLVLISSLQIRLDEQRLIADDVQRQTNTSLEVRIYDLESEVQTLKEAVSSKEKTVKQLTNTIEQTKRRLEDREKQLRAEEEDEVVAQLRKQVQDLQTENIILETNLKSNVQSAQILPNLVDNIIADKNADIEKLREKLSDTEKQLEAYLSLNLDRDQLKNLSMLKSSDRALGDILSLIPDPARRAANQTESLSSMTEIPYKRAVNETAPIGGTFEACTEISSIERVPPSKESTPIVAEKRVHFEDTQLLNAEILELKNEIYLKDEVIKELTDRLKALEELQRNVEKLQKDLENTESSLQTATEAFEAEQKRMRDVERELRVELAEKKVHLTEKQQQLEVYEQDSVRKDQMYIALAKEKREIEKRLNEIEDEVERHKDFDNVIAEKNREIYRLEEQLAEITEPDVRQQGLEIDLGKAREELVKKQEEAKMLTEKVEQMEDLQIRLKELEVEMSGQSEINQKLSKELENKTLQIQQLHSELEYLKESLEEKTKQLVEVKKLKELVADRECEIEILNEDTRKYQDDLARLEEELASSRKVLASELDVHLARARKDMAERDLEITNLRNTNDNLKKELAHLQELVNEKDKIINQMSEDSKSLHVNLETIQSKIQETGNIVDLARRLRDEQKLNVELQEEIHGLKAMLLSQGRTGGMAMSIEEITGQVRRELDYSAHLDSSILSALESGGEDNKETETVKDALTKQKSLNKELKTQKEVLRKSLQDTQQKLEMALRNTEILQIHLEKEKQNSNVVQIEDAKLIEQMRIQLDAALDNEMEFQKMLEAEKQVRANLEAQILQLKRKTEAVSSSSNSKTELTEYKLLPNFESGELVRLQKEVERLQVENDGLKADLKGLKRLKRENEANLKYMKDMLELKAGDIKKFEERVAKVVEAEMTVRKELFETKATLQQKQKEVDNSRVLMDEIEEDRRALKRQLNEANEKLKRLGNSERMYAEALGDQLNAPVPEKLSNKIKELMSLVKDNKQMTDTLAKLTDERRLLQERILELENLHPEHVDYNELEERTNHLFGRFLRAESYRKALIWQKRYLVGLLSTYQNSRPLNDLLVRADAGRGSHNRVKLGGLRSFRSAVYAVIAISRLQFITKRWHSGVRNTYHRHRRSPQVQNLTRQPAATFSSTQFRPVNENVVPVVLNETLPSVAASSRNVNSAFGRPLTPSNDDSLPWSGSTPPSKDMGLRGLNRNGNAQVIPDSSPLTTPDLLSRYIERFTQIQNRLGIVLDNKPL